MGNQRDGSWLMQIRYIGSKEVAACLYPLKDSWDMA